MSVVAFCFQNSVDPEAIKAGLLNDDERIVAAGSATSLLLQLSEAAKKPGNIPAGDGMTR